MEIVALGPNCTGAHFFSCSATKGITILRLARDDEYITAMLHFAASFHTKYVATNTTPPPDFMRTEPGYDAFLNHTLRLARGVQRVALIAPADVQRSPLNGNLFNAVPY
uniref:Uncharacterized protein n=1 Tax=Eutreptiella gymnastica TaxID=73025 RepID=A0A7S4LMB4_9EUGL